jgi:pyruvate kinase
MKRVIADPAPGLRAHKTKIVATVGPLRASEPVMESMIRAGLDIARLNFLSRHLRRSSSLHRESARIGARRGPRDRHHGGLAGPKIRLGMLAGERAHLAAGETFT